LRTSTTWRRLAVDGSQFLYSQTAMLPPYACSPGIKLYAHPEVLHITPKSQRTGIATSVVKPHSPSTRRQPTTWRLAITALGSQRAPNSTRKPALGRRLRRCKTQWNRRVANTSLSALGAYSGAEQSTEHHLVRYLESRREQASCALLR
jgi:hypothetical protein